MTTLGHNPFPDQLPLNGPYTAHPKIDPDTGDLIGFGYGMKGAESNDVGGFVIVCLYRFSAKCFATVHHLDSRQEREAHI